MRRVRLLVWLGGALGVALALWLLTDRPPRMPGDGGHDVTQAEAHCLTCHAHVARHPRPADHPLRDDCFSCHRDAAGALHAREGAPTGIPGGWGDDPRLNPTRR